MRMMAIVTKRDKAVAQTIRRRSFTLLFVTDLLVSEV